MEPSANEADERRFHDQDCRTRGAEAEEAPRLLSSTARARAWRAIEGLNEQSSTVTQPHLIRRALLISSASLVAVAALASLIRLGDAVVTRELGAHMSNVKTVQSFFEAQYAGDFDGAFDSFADPEFEWVVSMTNDEALNRAIPWAGITLVGKDSYMRLATQLWTEFEPLEFNFTRFTDGGDRVFAEGRFLFRHRTTGKTAASDFVARFEMRGGKIAGGQFYENTYAVAQARSAR